MSESLNTVTSTSTKQTAIEAVTSTKQTAVALVVATFTSDIETSKVYKRAGEAFGTASNKFFITTVALFLQIGDKPARELTANTWADSKNKSREYALKIFRMCTAAIGDGKLSQVREVQGFADLHALVPKKVVPDAAPKEPVADSAPTETAPSDDLESHHSRAAEIAATMLAADALIERLLAQVDKSTKADRAAAASDASVLRASLATLFNV